MLCTTPAQPVSRRNEIIKHQGAEAITTDGMHRDIYVRNTELVEELPNSTN